MSGRYLLDTNAIIYAFNRKLKLPVAQYVVSVITKMELLSWPALTPGDELKLREILQNLAVIELDPPIQDAAVKVRKKHVTQTSGQHNFCSSNLRRICIGN